MLAQHDRTMLEKAPPPTPAAPVAPEVRRVVAAPVAVHGLVTGADVVDALPTSAVPARPSGGLAPLRRQAARAAQAARAGTLRRCNHGSGGGQVGKKVTTWDAKVIATPVEKLEIEEREQSIEAEHGVEAGRIIRESRAQRAADVEVLARDQQVTEAVLTMGEGAPHKAHWDLMVGYGEAHARQWVKIDLLEAGYRLIWKAMPQGKGTSKPVALQGTVGNVLEHARAIATENTTYYNPDIADVTIAQQGGVRYSCQHFAVKLLARFGVVEQAAVV